MGDTTVVLVGTLDTKGREYAFLRDRLHAAGVRTILVDAGIMGPPLVEPDVTREEVATADDAFLEEEEEGEDDVTGLIDGDIEDDEET